MIEKIDCPSYIQTYSTDEGENKIEVAMIPWDQFHTLMTMVGANNNKIIEVNTLLSDMVEAYPKYPSPLLQRAKVYLEGR